LALGPDTSTATLREMLVRIREKVRRSLGKSTNQSRVLGGMAKRSHPMQNQPGSFIRTLIAAWFGATTFDGWLQTNRKLPAILRVFV
jgi:hypothetical protein